MGEAWAETWAEEAWAEEAWAEEAWAEEAWAEEAWAEEVWAEEAWAAEAWAEEAWAEEAWAEEAWGGGGMGGGGMGGGGMGGGGMGGGSMGGGGMGGGGMGGGGMGGETWAEEAWAEVAWGEAAGHQVGVRVATAAAAGAPSARAAMARGLPTRSATLPALPLSMHVNVLSSRPLTHWFPSLLLPPCLLSITLYYSLPSAPALFHLPSSPCPNPPALFPWRSSPGHGRVMASMASAGHAVLATAAGALLRRATRPHACLLHHSCRPQRHVQDGPIGFALNGVPFYSVCDVWHYEKRGSPCGCACLPPHARIAPPHVSLSLSPLAVRMTPWAVTPCSTRAPPLTRVGGTPRPRASTTTTSHGVAKPSAISASRSTNFKLCKCVPHSPITPFLRFPPFPPSHLHYLQPLLLP
ncbi:unnamed protein product [Closterium sp. NIES-65]|nr:unnamed protein product [Closterium sp. NIES-65]